jgi:hypothetical protein
VTSNKKPLKRGAFCEEIKPALTGQLVHLSRALPVKVHHLAAHTIFNGEHLASVDDQTTLLARALGWDFQLGCMLFTLLTCLSHRSAPYYDKLATC